VAAVSPHSKQFSKCFFSDTSWMSFLSTRFWCYLPKTVSDPQLTAQSHKTTPSLRCQLPAQTFAPGLPARNPTPFSLGLVIC
jgi:hypothetical protein